MPVEAPLQDLVDRYYGRIWRAAALLTGCTWDADDLTQETFARAAESWHRFSGRGDTFTWLYGILLNTDRSRRRRILRWLQCHTGLTVTWRDAQTNEEPADEFVLWPESSCC